MVREAHGALGKLGKVDPCLKSEDWRALYVECASGSKVELRTADVMRLRRGSEIESNMDCSSQRWHGTRSRKRNSGLG